MMPDLASGDWCVLAALLAGFGIMAGVEFGWIPGVWWGEERDG